MKYRVLGEQLAVCRLPSEARIPAWALEGGFFCVVRTRDELSIVCREDVCTADRIPDGAPVERGWVALKLEGPFPFSMTGVLASFVQPLAEAGIPIFAISTFDTDYVLIKRQNLEQAVLALAAARHENVG
ncbi:MAG: ACT domain-containing protein [Acidobacteriia bacterium]|nr:ACT domain-containing protein [Terriglobia bacterium]